MPRNNDMIHKRCIVLIGHIHQSTCRPFSSTRKSNNALNMTEWTCTRCL